MQIISMHSAPEIAACPRLWDCGCFPDLCILVVSMPCGIHQWGSDMLKTLIIDAVPRWHASFIKWIAGRVFKGPLPVSAQAVASVISCVPGVCCRLLLQGTGLHPEAPHTKDATRAAGFQDSQSWRCKGETLQIEMGFLPSCTS